MTRTRRRIRDAALTAFLLVPLVVWIVNYWSIYVGSRALQYSAVIGVAVGGVLTWVMSADRRRLRGLGVRLPGDTKGMLAAWFLLSLVCTAWCALLFTTPVILDDEVKDRVFFVSEVHVCKRRCKGCRVSVNLKDWLGKQDDQLCADGLTGQPQVGDRIQVFGRFQESAIYVNSVERFAEKTGTIPTALAP